MTKIRSGIGSLQFMIAGSGNLPSKLILGGTSVGLVLGIEDWRRSPGLDGISIFGANWCSLLAYDSRLVAGTRGGSIGTKVNGVRCAFVSA